MTSAPQSLTPVLDQVLPPAGHAAFEVRAGQLVRLVDLEGGQVADFFSFALPNRRDRLSMYFSRALNLTWKLTQGHRLIGTQGTHLWTIVEDTLGDNYSGGGYCNPRVNTIRYARPDAPTCEANIVAALQPWGMTADSFDADTCFNVFMNVAYDADGKWEIRDPKGRAGDHIDLRAEVDQLVAVSNCPQLLNRCNGGRLKPLGVQVLSA
jgi:uncharacterized protein YcgI (DUF1989 family)